MFSFSCSKDMMRTQKFRHVPRDHDHAQLEVLCHLKAETSYSLHQSTPVCKRADWGG